ncbi:MAG: RNA-directed DNA polymerase [Ruminococcus sp.]
MNNNGNANNNNANNGNGVAFGSSSGRRSKPEKAETRLKGEKESATLRKVNIALMGPGGRCLHGGAWRLCPVTCPVTLYGYANRQTAGQSTQKENKGRLTSEERRRGRYLRRQQARREKKEKKHGAADNFEQVFTFENLYRAYKECRKGVAWKASVQRYIANAPINVIRTRDRLLRGAFKSPGFYEFDIHERGKLRHIRSTVINERVVQRCLCDNSLVPLLQRTFIYDNGASMRGKGYHFAIRRLTAHLLQHYRKHGNEGYILLFDFSKFFDSVSHAVVKQILNKELTDERLIKLSEHFVDVFGDVGLGLGSQISQVLALSSANRLDHYIGEVLRINKYGRYMDDGYLIHRSKSKLKACLEGIKEICKILQITLNQKKTQIVKLSHGFTWLKVRFYLTKTGRVVKKIYKRSVTKMRIKLKKLKKFYDAGKITFDYIYQSWQSWRSYARRFDAYHTIKNMARLFDDLFIFNREETQHATH